MGRAELILIGIGLVGCDNGTAVVMDASPLDTAPDDAGIDTGPTIRCNPSSPFGTPTSLDEINSANDDQFPRLAKDELTIYWSVATSTNRTLHFAKRSSIDEPFGPDKLVFPTYKEDLWAPSISGDGRTLFYVHWSDNRILQATYVTTDTWFMQQAGIPNPTVALDQFVSSDGSLAYWTTYIFNSGYRLQRMALKPLAKETLAGTGQAPVLSEDNNVLYFSDKTSATNQFGILRFSYITSTMPEPIVELDTPGNEEPGWISADDCVLYYASTQNGKFDLFMAKRGM